MYTYKTKGTCSSHIHIELSSDIITHVSFENGCQGNLRGVSRLVEGLTVKEAIEKLRGISCGSKPTSCPDQLSYALEEAQKEQQQSS